MSLALEEAAFEAGLISEVSGYPSSVTNSLPDSFVSLHSTPSSSTIPLGNTAPPLPPSPSSSTTSSLPDVGASRTGKKRRRGPCSHGPGRNASNKARGRKNRKQARIANSDLKLDDAGVYRNPSGRKPFQFGGAEAVDEALDTSSLPTASTGYVGRTGELPPPVEFWLHDVVGETSRYKFKLIPALEPGCVPNQRPIGYI